MLINADSLAMYLAVATLVVVVLILAAVLNLTWRSGGACEAQSNTSPTLCPADPQADRVVFVVDCLLLASLFRHCTSQGMDEVFAYVAGFALEPNRFVLQHIIPVAHAQQSAIGAKADPISTIEVHDAIDDVGLRIVAHAHSHPGIGRGATHPSCVDRKYVADLSAGSSRLLGLIISRGRSGGGYVRAYAHEGFEFDIEIQGTGISKVSDDEERFQVFEIDDRLAAGDLPIATAGAARRTAGPSPAGPTAWF
jgi:proteasome lid subunit RPN8/RPN11